MTRSLLPLGVLAALVLAAPAQAATAEATVGQCAAGPCATILKVTAAPGERNDLTLTVDGAGVVVRDDGAPLAAGESCERREDGSVRCAPSRPIDFLELFAGDGDDVVRTPAWNVTTYVTLGEGADRSTGIATRAEAVGQQNDEVVGGPGDDVLAATGPAPSTLRGGEGADVLTGGDGPELLAGEEGRDRLDGGAGDDVLNAVDQAQNAVLVENPVPAGDTIDGGPGRDRVSYERTRTGVRVDLLRGIGGVAGENDALEGVEDAEGGYGPDHLSGDGGANVLLGGDAADVLAGRGGDDDLRGGSPFELGGPEGFDVKDRIDGGGGDDVLRASFAGALVGGDGDDVLATGRVRGVPPASPRRRASSATCGEGRDVVRVSRGTTPTVDRSCERWALRLAAVDRDFRRTSFRLPVLRRDAVRFSVPCPARITPSRCLLKLDVTTPEGRVLGRDRALVRDGLRPTLVARLRGAPPSRIRVLVGVRKGRLAVNGGVIVATR